MITDDTLAGDLRLAVLRLNRCLRNQRVDSDPLLRFSPKQAEFLPTLSQLSALSALHMYGPMTPSTLASLEQITRPSTTWLITSLEALGLLHRTPHPTDGRQVILTVTDLGADYIRHHVHTREVWLNHRLTDLDDTDRRTLRASITLLDHLAGTHPQHPDTPTPNTPTHPPPAPPPRPNHTPGAGTDATTTAPPTHQSGQGSPGTGNPRHGATEGVSPPIG